MPDYVKSEPHIILGTNKDGNPIYFTRVGVLNDVLEWGMDVGDIVDLINGKTTWKDIAKRMPKKALQKTIDMISPFYKTPFELLTAKKLFPDATNPTHIRDRWLYVAQSLGVERLGRIVMGKPVKNRGNVAELALTSLHTQQMLMLTPIILS